MKYSSFVVPRVTGITSKFTNRPESVAAAELDLQVSFADDDVFLLGPANRVSQLHVQPFARHLQKAQTGPARRELEVPVHISPGVNDFHVLVYEHCCRSVLCQKSSVEFLLGFSIVPY